YLERPVNEQQIDDLIETIARLIQKPPKTVLLLSDWASADPGLSKLGQNGEVRIVSAASCEQALEKLSAFEVDCIILDMGSQQELGFQLFRYLAKLPDSAVPPALIYHSASLSATQLQPLRAYTHTALVREVTNPGLLVNELR